MKNKTVRKTLFFIFFIIIILYIIFSSSLFRIKEISVYGNNKIKSDEIKNFASLNGNENYFRLRENSIEEKIYNTGKFERVEVIKNFPNNIEINVTERKPACLLKVKDGFIIIDRFGVILDKTREKDYNLKVLKVSNDRYEYNPGTNIRDYIEEDKKELVDKIFTANNIYKYNEIDIFGKEANLVLANNILVKFGSFKDVDYKLKVIDEIVETTEREKFNKVKMIRLEDGENPVLVFE